MWRAWQPCCVRHQRDTRPWDGEGGFGVGTLLFETGENGEVTGVGWQGTDSLGTLALRVVFGRVVR